jgi:hypothetical protein
VRRRKSIYHVMPRLKCVSTYVDQMSLELERTILRHCLTDRAEQLLPWILVGLTVERAVTPAPLPASLGAQQRVQPAERQTPSS